MSTQTMISATSQGQGEDASSAKVLYPADQQERFLSLQAETEILLNQLQTMKAQRLATPTVKPYHTT